MSIEEGKTQFNTNLTNFYKNLLNEEIKNSIKEGTKSAITEMASNPSYLGSPNAYLEQFSTKISEEIIKQLINESEIHKKVSDFLTSEIVTLVKSSTLLIPPGLVVIAATSMTNASPIIVENPIQ